MLSYKNIDVLIKLAILLSTLLPTLGQLLQANFMQGVQPKQIESAIDISKHHSLQSYLLYSVSP